MKKLAYVTNTICGRVLTLKEGEAYLATAPIEAFGRSGQLSTEPFSVAIHIQDKRLGLKPVACVNNLTRTGVCEFLRNFNNGRSSFSGRVWKSEDKPQKKFKTVRAMLSTISDTPLKPWHSPSFVWPNHR